MIALAICLAAALPAHASDDVHDDVYESLATARDGQQHVLQELARILQEEKTEISDGAVQSALEALLREQQAQQAGIRDLGRRTLGQAAEDMTPEDQAEQRRLVDAQDASADRYQRLERTIDAKAGARPNSVFAAMLLMADDERLLNRMRNVAELLRQAQLARAMQETDAVVEALEHMVAMIHVGEAGTAGGHMSEGFSPPSLWQREEDQFLPHLGWPNAPVLDALGSLRKSALRMRELAKEQRELAGKVQVRSATMERDEALGQQEWEIRHYVLEVGGDLGLVDRDLHAMILQAGETLELAAGIMQQGPLREAVEPAWRATREMDAAADALEAVWRDVLDRIKSYTQATEPYIGGEMSFPHPVPKEWLEAIKRDTLRMLRATGAMTEAMAAQEALLARTIAAATPQALPEMKPEQAALADFIDREVLPFNVEPMELLGLVRTGQLENDPMVQRQISSSDLLREAMEEMRRAAGSLGNNERDASLEHEDLALEMMTEAMHVMVRVLQQLLGQFGPTVTASGMGGAMGMALDPEAGEPREAAWVFDLPQERQEAIHQAFRGAFPQRYDASIKRYYEAIAQEDFWDAE